ncbi:MKRN2 opposite strand protein-like [Exaiptasia diaphana]|uniref:MKRN2 opposite strand protein n=1 Tax=Exaiptasia diaphana TaxID=2652724 RepID=A0A913XER9_EXADI|nr:MKRN2 opposite strand protein-like [Exaiptasia diaphana]
MNSSKQDKVMCMQHCSRQENIFYIDFPLHCPICGLKLQNCQLIVPPFCVPSPLVSASFMTLSCCILVKQTHGDFLRDYRNGENLHIGITDSKGFVYNYDEQGVCIEKDNWNQCAVLELESADSQMWDSVLERSTKSNTWSSERYHETSLNCYDYVLSMLKEINKGGFFQDSKQLYSKEEFSKHLIVPLTRKVAKYIELYRNIKSKGTCVLPFSSGDI